MLIHSCDSHKVIMAYSFHMFHIIDDAHLTCDLMEEVIETHGYPAISFNHAEEYIEYVKSPRFRRPIGTFVDIIMPDMDGYDLIDKVSALKPEMRFVVMTSEPKIRSEHINNACMFLGKPLIPKHIIKVIDSLIRCQAFSPDHAHGCHCNDHRELFPTEEWSCPVGFRSQKQNRS